MHANTSNSIAKGLLDTFPETPKKSINQEFKTYLEKKLHKAKWKNRMAALQRQR